MPGQYMPFLSLDEVTTGPIPPATCLRCKHMPIRAAATVFFLGGGGGNRPVTQTGKPLTASPQSREARHKALDR